MGADMSYMSMQPHVDFGLRVLGADVIAVPGFYQFVQEYIRKQVASLYLWPQTLNVPILQDSLSGTIKKPVGILHVKVLRAEKLLKMDIIGTSDPCIKIELTGERLPPKKTSIKMRNLNPEWDEDFMLTVKDPESQFIQFHVFDWDQMIKRTHLPYWNEEFQFVVEEATLKKKIRFEVKSKKRNHSAYRFRRKELLGYIDINFGDVVYNGRIRGQYNLINSKNGVLHVELHWSTT